MRRASHQLLDEPRLLDDPFALRILGARTEAELRADPQALNRHAGDLALRAFVVVRSRIAEDALAAAVAAGIRQYVVLGAGLDTFAYRNPFPELRVFEVDFPATQTWKRHRLETAGIPIPPTLTFVPVDFERQRLSDELRHAGFAADRPAWFSWLGVTPYLEHATILSTFRDIASLAGAGGGVVLDYGVEPSLLTLGQRMAVRAVAARVRLGGEPFKSYFTPEGIAADLRATGFEAIDDLSPAEINARYFANRREGLRVSAAGRVLVARTLVSP